MITNWSPAHVPEKEEVKERLRTAREQLYDYWYFLKDGDPQEREVPSEK